MTKKVRLTDAEREQLIQYYTWSENAIQGKLPTSFLGWLSAIPGMVLAILVILPYFLLRYVAPIMVKNYAGKLTRNFRRRS